MEIEFAKILNDICIFFNELPNKIDKINKELINQKNNHHNINKGLHTTNINANIFDNIHNFNDADTHIILNDPLINYSGIMYDIYYYFLIKQNEGQLNKFTLNDFEYPISFTITFNNPNYNLKIILLDDNGTYHVCTMLLYKCIGETIKHHNGYSNKYKKHTTYNSILNELFKLQELIA